MNASWVDKAWCDYDERVLKSNLISFIKNGDCDEIIWRRDEIQAYDCYLFLQEALKTYGDDETRDIITLELFPQTQN